jgi:hypothetical protein
MVKLGERFMDNIIGQAKVFDNLEQKSLVYA